MKKTFLLLLALAISASCAKKQETTGQEEAAPLPEEATPTEQVQGPKKQTLTTSSGKSFLVLETETEGSLADIRIIPQGFPNTADTIFLQGVDPVSQMFTGDLNQDGFEELYLITTAAGSGSYATIYGCASNKDLSATSIYVPDLNESDLAPGGKFEGYMGHDSIYLKDNTIFRKFPVYKEGDANCCPTGGDRTLGYALRQGEASCVLDVKK